MTAGAVPPVIAEFTEPKLEPGPKVARWRWWFHLVVLAMFPLLAGVAGVLTSRRTTALLPGTFPGLLRISIYELGLFTIFFLIAWLASRFRADQLQLKWRGGILPPLWGLLGSVVLRVGIMVIMIFGLGFLFAVHGMDAGQFQKLRPHMGHMVDMSSLAQDPVYLVFMLTFFSFVVAALREELWRSAMLAGINALFPEQYKQISGRVAAVMVVALVFGLGHTAQGVLGVAATGMLGVGLGGIMVWRRSIWEAVFAHGFFDAGSFLALYLVAKYAPGQIPNL